MKTDTSAGIKRAREPRAVLRVTGERALAFLHATTTQDVAGLQPGGGALACTLDHAGKLQAEFRVLALPDGRVLLDAESAARAALAESLARIAPLSGCEVTDESDAWSFERVWGPGAAGLFGATPPETEHASVMDGDAVIVRVEWGPHGFDVLTPDATAAAAAGDWDADRIPAGRPRFGVDIEAGTLINETPLLARAVSFTKGCYPGQESVARVHNLGTPRHVLALLALDGPAPARGADVLVAEEPAGVVTSAAPDENGSVAIARVRSTVQPDLSVVAGGITGRVRAIL